MRIFDPRSNRLMTLFTLLSVMILSTCSVNQVGLGAKVDITPPKVKITGINQAASKDGLYLKGSVTVSGTASDDIGVSGLSLSYVRPDNTTVAKPLTLSGGTWTTVLTSGSGAADDLREGAQTLEVVVSDGSSKSSSDRILLYIDNTAPTLMVTYPLSHGTTAALIPQSTDTIDIKGEVSDQSPITQVVVTILDAAGKPLASNDPVKNPNPKTADGSNTFATRFYLKGTATIPGLQVTDKGAYYYQVVATDAAGNANTWYYHSNDIPDLLAAGTPLPNTGELASIDHAAAGAVSSPSNIAVAALTAVRLGLSSPPATAPIGWGNFTYVASSAPSIQFSNLTQAGAQSQNLLGPGSVVAGTISPLPNTGAIDGSTVQVKLYQLQVPPFPTTLGSPLVSLDNKTPNLVLTSLGDSLGFVVNLKDGSGNDLPPNPYYMTVSAKTKNSDLASTQAAFFIDSGAPSLTAVTLPSFANAPFTFTGTAAAPLGLDHLDLYQSTDTTQGPIATTVPLSGTSANWTSTALPSPLADGTYNYTLKLMTVSGKNAVLYQTVTYDQTPPEVFINRPSTVIGTSSVNGDVEFTAAATDANGLTGAKWGFLPAASTPPAWTDSQWKGFTSSTLKATVDTLGTDLTGAAVVDNQDYRFWVITQDKAGNIGTGSYLVHVDQSTDLPTVTFANLNATATVLTKAEAKTKGNLLETGAKLVPTLADDDGVDLTKVDIKIDDVLNGVSGSFATMGLTGTSKSKSLEYSLSSATNGQLLTQGVYAVTIRALDVNGKTATVGPVVFAIDLTAPGIVLDTPLGSFQKADFTLSGSAQHALGLDTAKAVVVRDETQTAIKTFTAAELTGTPAVQWTMTAPLAGLSEGSHMWSITATDYFDKSSTKSFDFNVDRTAAVSAITAPGADGSTISGTSATFSGTATDGSGSGVKKVQYALVYSQDGNDANDTWVDATGTNSWTFTVASMAATFGSEGPKVFGVRTVDNAGNVSASSARTFVYDTAAPLVSVTGAATRDTKVAFSLSGTASDNYGIGSIAITQKKDGGTAQLVSTNGPTGTTTWSLGNLPRDPANIGSPLPIDGTPTADGTYLYDVVATDLAGKTSLVASVTVRVDQTAPDVLTIIDPAAGLTGVNSLTGKTNLFRGTVSDAGVGTAKIWYLIDANPTATTNTTGYTSVATGNGNWSFTDTRPSEGRWYFHLKAEDKAGNVSAIDLNTAGVVPVFDIDQAAPVLTETAMGNAVQNTKIKTGITIGGTWTETNGVASFTVRQVKDGDTANPVVLTQSFNQGSAGNPTWALVNLPRSADDSALDPTDGLYDYTFTITDVAGKTSTLLRSFRLDTTGPSVNVLNPSDDTSWSSTSSYTVSGAATDLTGVRAIFYAKAASAPALPADPTVDGNWVGWTKLVGTNSWSIGLTGLSEGANQTLWVSAVDTAGNTSAPSSRAFGVDTAKPTLAAATPAPNTNAGFGLSGTSFDSVGIASVSVTQAKDGGSVIPISTNGVAGSTTWSLTGLPRDPGSIGNTASLTSADNGAYEYVITVTDLSGKTTSLTRTVRFDKSAPAVTITGPLSDGSTIASTSFSFSGIASDGSDSGVSLVEYSVDAGASWASAVGTNSWSFNIAGMAASFGAEGVKAFRVRATDNAGNTSTPATISDMRSFVFDTAAPLAGITAPGSLNTKVAFSLAGTATDNYGIASLTITQQKDAGSTVTVATFPALLAGSAQSTTWTLGTDVALPRDPASIGTALMADGNYTYNVTATDLAGKTSNVATITMKVDRSAPATLTVIDPAAGLVGVNALTSKTNLFQGSVSDGAGVGTARIWYLIDHSTAAGTGTVGYTSVTTGNGTWSFTDTNRAEGSWNLHVKAEDQAGNVTADASAVTVAFDIDTAAPVLTETTMGNAVQNTKVQSGISISGTWTESNGVASFTVRQVKDGDTANPVVLTQSFNQGSAGNPTWALVNLPRSADDSALDPTDGLYDYTFTITDVAGKTSTILRSFRLDTTGPSVVVQNPSDDNSWAGSSSYSISGAATDLTGVRAIFYAKAASAPALPADPKVDGNWVGWTKLVGTNSWSIALTGLSEGANQTVWVCAVDTAGNTSTPKDRTFGVDFFKPTLGAATPPANTNVGFGLSGSSADNVGVSSVVVTQSKDGGSAIPVTTNGVSGTTSWSLANLPRDPGAIGTQAVAAVDNGVYEYTITATDQAGKTTSVTRTVRFDKTAPSVTISGPLANGTTIASSSFSFSGVASDGIDSGVALVEYSTDAGTTWNSAVGTSGWSFSIANMAATFGAEGTKDFRVRATDNAGNTSVPSTTSDMRSFVFDTAAPLAGITAPGSLNTKVAFSLAGTASDNYGIASLTITQQKDAGSVVTISTVPAQLGGTVLARTWTLGLDTALPRDPGAIGTALLADGNYTYNVTATDLAGKTSNVATVSIKVDQSAPSTLTVIDPAAGLVGVNALTSKTNLFQGSVSDGAGVGTAKIWYLIDHNTAAGAGTAGYTAVTTGNGPWNFTDTNRAEGSWNLHVKAEDQAGNVTADLSAVNVPFDIDISAPSLAETTVNTTVAVDKKAGFGLDGTASDTQGMTSVSVTQEKDGGGPVAIVTSGPTTSDAWATWSLANLPRNPGSIGTQSLVDGVYVYVVTATDLAGKTTKVTRTISFDTQAPVITFADPVPAIYDANALGAGQPGYKVNGAVSLTGSITDNKSVASLTTKIGSQTAVVQGNKYSFTLPIDTTAYGTFGHTDSSNLTVTVTAADPAGNSVTNTYTMRVDQSSDNPLITFTNLDSSVTTAGAAANNLLQYNASLLGSAQDDDSIDKTKVQVAIDGGAFVAVSSPPGTNGALVNFTHDLSVLSEGVHRLQVKVGDIGVATTTSPAVYFVIDKSPPTVTITSPATGTGTNADFTMTGSASDTSGLKTYDFGAGLVPYVEWSSDGATYFKTALTTDNFSVPVTLGGTDGTQIYFVKATDIYGKTMVQDVRVQVDRALPTVSYIYPASGTSLNGKATIRGSASDNNSVSTVEYSLNGGTTWTAVTGDKYAWSFQFDTTGLTQGALGLKVRATDTSNNVSATATLPLTLDQSSDYPVVTIVNMDQTKLLIGQAGSNLQESNAQIQGSITDDDWLDSASIAYRIDGGSWLTPASVGSNSTIVTFQQSLTGLSDGVHSIEVKASDTDDGANGRKAGLTPVTTTITPFYFAIDKSNPVVVITNPASTYTTGLLTLTGTVTDGNQSSAVQISTDGGATYSVTGISGFTAGLGSRPWSWTGDLSGKPEGPFTVKMKGIDQFNKESVADLTITVDHTGPTMAISAPAASSTVNGPVTISGTSVEPYGIAIVEVAVVPQGNTPSAGDWQLATGTYSWTYLLDSTLKTDGNYSIWVRGTDAAGNTSIDNGTQIAKRNFAVSQASDKPAISLSTVSLGGTYAQNLLPGSLQISGTASDDDAVKAGSIQISLNGGTTWTNVSGQPALDANVVTWSHTFTGLADGQYQFLMRAGDVNFSGTWPASGGDLFKTLSIGPVNFAVDTALPTGAVTYPAQGAYLKNPGTGTIAMTGTSADASGVQKVEIKINNGAAQTVTGTTGWNYDYPIGSDGLVNYQIIITDNYNKISTIDRYFTIDTSAPTLAFTQPTANATVNGSLLIAGNSSETNQMDKVYFWMGANAASPTGSPTTGDWTGWTLLGGTYSWQNRIDTTLLSPGAYDIHVRALDAAGNLSLDKILANITVNQTTNLPSFTSLNLTASPANNLFGTGGTITGVVSDDDSVDASTLQISTDNGATWSNVTSQGTSGPTVNFSHNLTTAGLAQSGTAYSVKFRVNDIAGANPGDGSVSTTTPAYLVAYDTSLPTVAVASINYNDRYSASPVSVTGGSLPGALVNNSFTLKTTASDASGVTSLTVSLNGAAAQAATFQSGTGTWDRAFTLDMAGHSNDGTYTFAITASDAWGKTNTTNLSIVIDTTEPTVNFLNPANLSTVNGTVTVQGTSFDGGALNPISAKGGASSNVTFTNTGTSSSWTWQFDSNLYASATYATETSTGSNVWTFPMSVTVTDAAGNRTVAARTVSIDPNSDKPVVVNVTLIPTNATSVSGTITVGSTVTDDDGPAYVRVYADLNDDGTITAAAYPRDLNANGNTTDAFETESNYLQVAVGNGVWTTQVNGNNEFSKANMTARGIGTPTGWLRFQVVPYDINGLAGNPVWRRVYLDATSPSITSLNYTSGTMVKGTIAVTGTISDDATLDTAHNAIQISFDGGSSFQDLSVTDLGFSGGLQNYSFSQTINTSTINANAFAGGSGVLYLVLKVTDQTFKQSQVNLNFNVDNKLPTAAFNSPVSLAYQGTYGSGEIYSFYDTGKTANNLVVGQTADTGAVSGIASVKVYFVRQKSGTYYAFLPTRTVDAVALIAGRTYMIKSAGTSTFTANGAGDNNVGTVFTAGGTGSGTGVLYAVKAFPGNDPTQAPVGDTINATAMEAGVRYKIVTMGTTTAAQWKAAGVPSAVQDSAIGAGTYFLATGAAAGSGTVVEDYLVTIDRRTELGNYDTDTVLGDNDGFNESLKPVSGYDEWSAYYNTKVLPDGPMVGHYLAYDNAGNAAHGTFNGQITNSPPSIDNVEVDGSHTLYTSLIKRTNSVYLKILASDTAGGTIDTSGYTATLTAKRVAPSGASTTLGPALGTTFPVSVAGDFTINVQESPATSFVSGVVYTLTLQAKDNDGNQAVKTVEFWVNNSDSVPPIIRQGTTDNNFDEFAQANLAVVAFPATAVNAATDVIASTSLPAWAVNNTPVVFAQGRAPTGITAGNPYYLVGVVAGTSFQISATSGGAAVNITAAGNGTYTLQLAGHIDEAANSLHNGTDADLSGVVAITGNAYDDSTVTAVTVEISINGGTSYTTLGSAVLGAATGDVLSGYTRPWTYLWNTATVTGVALDNVKIRAFASDGTNTTLTANRPVKTLDVVPYITAMEKSAKAVARSRLGKYPLLEGDTAVTLRGYNLNGATGVGGLLSVRNTAGGATVNLWVTAVDTTNYTSLVFSVDNDTNAGNTPVVPSGYLYVTTNSVLSVNNVNSDQLAQNLENVIGQSATDFWTNKRYLQAWKNNVQLDTSTNGTNAVHPVMSLNPVNKELAGGWINLSTNYAGWKQLGGTLTNNSVVYTYDPPEYNDFVADDGGFGHQVFLGNSSSGNTWGYYQLVNGSVTLGAQTAGGRNSNNVEILGNGNVGTQNSTDGQDEQLFQFRNGRVTTVNDAGTRYAYTSYYDAFSKSLKYAVTTGATRTMTVDGSNYYTAQNAVVDGTDYFVNSPTITADVGLWSSIVVDKVGETGANYYPVILYYDSQNQQLKVARGLTNMRTATGPTGWSISAANVTPTLSAIGSYVKAAIDTSGNIHAVCYDADSGVLQYLYAPNINGAGGTYTFTMETVDDTTGVGAYPDIQILNGVPYVSYMYSALADTPKGLRFAYKEGANWEYSTVPATVNVKLDRTSVAPTTKTTADGANASWARTNVANTAATNVAVSFAGTYFELMYLRPEN